MQNLLRRARQDIPLRLSVLCLLLFLFTACGGSGTPAASSTRTAHTNEQAATPTATPAIQYGTQPCPTAVSQSSYWDPIVPTQPTLNKVESVSCAYLMGIPQLQALVLVRAVGTGAALDVRVYNNITSPTPTRIFLLQGLVHGDVKVSGYNTLITSEVDQNSTANADVAAAAQQTDLHREFKWFDKASTLVPIAFPGIFPDLTRYEAEADQQKVNQGQQGWMLDATQTAQHFVSNQQLLKWSINSQVSVVSGGGKNDVNAVVTVKNTLVPAGSIKLSMSRLENNTNGGIWIITSAATDGMSITSPQSLDHLESPIAVSGSGNAFEGVVGRVLVLDHLYTKIGNVVANGGGNGNASFTASAPYTSTFKNGTQEGLVVLYSYSNANGSIDGAVFVKALLN